MNPGERVVKIDPDDRRIISLALGRMLLQRKLVVGQKFGDCYGEKLLKRKIARLARKMELWLT